MKRIVIVEDDTVVGFVYKTSLSKEGFNVELMTDGEAGLSHITANTPDAVLLDLMLPKMPGVEVLKRIRMQPGAANIPIIVFTNAYVPGMINEALQAGASKVFNKAEVTPRVVVDTLKDLGCFANEN